MSKMKRVRVSEPSAFAKAISEEFAIAGRDAVARAKSAGVRVAGLKGAPPKAAPAPRKPRMKVVAKKGG